MKSLINVKIYTGKNIIENGYLRYAEKIEEIGCMSEFKVREEEHVKDGQNSIVIPGMIDIHIHGGYDVDAMDANPQTLLKLGHALMKEGVTTFFPTTITQSPDSIQKALLAIREAKDLGGHFDYIHLEGPFVNKKRAGAQPLQYIVKPDVMLFKKWQEISGNLIKLVTYAPELKGASELKEEFEKMGVVGTVGHSDAKINDFLGKKITHATHLFNQMRAMHHREPGTAGYALLSDEVMVEIIADGIHVHPDMIKLAYKLKGPRKISVITDSMRAKGLDEGEYELGGQPVFVKEKSARLADGTLAGSILKMDEAFRNIMIFTGCSVEEAVLMTSVNQAEEFGLLQKGVLEIGKDADFVEMTLDFHVIETTRLGKTYEEVTV
ncbi:N-acetylglucosamine-6-phosphate deacetylase [Bacillus sp. RG28]|uniref:N-acetylglucosamine-6-phosphate deacetylase n=1 Tax=Gottfriedia endophytica TaxID=2820819 RepID=A0A940NI22_9BACI|nr:N-acetylglucosamine-6-phosphate deacetylase [Gottfriedia endophytica]MBP0724705.1 N-acetylglucosamine-6-phosphate deacetylase [Gottfriedia endophytica]